MDSIRLTMAQALLRFLDQQYVERDGREYKFVQGVMGIFGHGNVNGIGEALENDPGDLPYIQGHNEQGMVHAAVAFAKQRNRLGIYACTTSIGPGALNMVTAAATATVNHIPVLLLPSDTFACRQPDPVLQQLEVPWDYTVTVNDVFKPISRYFDRIIRPEQLMTALLQAMRVLTDPGEAGAVTLSLPQDVQTEAYDYPVKFFHRRIHHLTRRRPEPEELSRVVDIIRAAKRPFIIVGGGVHYSEATQALQDFAVDFDIPVAETQAGKSALPWDHPCNVGAIGVTGSRAANHLAREADLIVAVGTRLSDFTTASKTAYPENVPVVTINVARFDALKGEAVPLIGDARTTLKAIHAALRTTDYHSEYAPGEISVLQEAWQREVDRLYAWTDPAGITQTGALGVINAGIDPEAIIVAAAGGLPGDLHRLWRAEHPKQYHVEYGFSCMGYEISGAFGVKLAEPDKPVYALVGDGSFLMLHSELLTSLQEHRKIIVIVFDNSGFQCIRSLQMAHGSAGFGNEMRGRDAKTHTLTGPILPLDFCRYAEGLGAQGFAAATPQQLREALALASASPRSAVIDMKVIPDTGTSNYESWWRVGVAAVSRNDRVEMAFRENQDHIGTAWPY